PMQLFMTPLEELMRRNGQQIQIYLRIELKLRISLETQPSATTVINLAGV
ncbi:MAG: hypothetical protein QOC84_1204, partial [Bradyrhizobium sp.]|nr:hypothetical protein [Bradyrhizobium sp.]